MDNNNLKISGSVQRFDSCPCWYELVSDSDLFYPIYQWVEETSDLNDLSLFNFVCLHISLLAKEGYIKTSLDFVFINHFFVVDTPLESEFEELV